MTPTTTQHAAHFAHGRYIPASKGYRASNFHQPTSAVVVAARIARKAAAR